MKQRFLVGCLFGISALAVSITHSEIKAPTFEQYRVAEQFVGKPAPVDFKSSPGSSMFRTRLRQGAKKGPNFAGHYTIVSWGCGMGCCTIAVIDAADGRILVPDEVSPLLFLGFMVGGVPGEQEGMEYKKDSSLFIAHGTPSTETKMGSYYYLWENEQFTLIFSRKWKTTLKK